MGSLDLRPFAIVDGKGFMNIALELLDTGAKFGNDAEAEDILPCGRTVSRNVQGEYDKIKQLVMEELRQLHHAALFCNTIQTFYLDIMQ